MILSVRLNSDILFPQCVTLELRNNDKHLELCSRLYLINFLKSTTEM